jgi:NADH dehydrogenase FAD-containing subunit
VVIAGLGDTGVLTAIGLAPHLEVVGISSKPEFVSGQELGTRLARPGQWERDNRFTFGQFRALDAIRTVHGCVTGLELDRRRVHVRGADGRDLVEPYDVLVVATGVTNGFWRRPELRSGPEITEELRAAHETLAAAGSLAVIGGGAAGVNTAAHHALRWPDHRVDLYYPRDRPLLHHHPRIWARVRERLVELGVGLHPGHRADVPQGFDGEAITHEPVTFTTGQPATTAAAVVWTIGRTRPNTAWLPGDLLDDAGFVKVLPTLQTPTHPEVFAVGDVAATDPLRSSARNRADRLLVANIRAHLTAGELGTFRAPRARWGSVLGIQPNGIEVFTASGGVIRFPSWTVERLLLGWYVRRHMYGGIRRRTTD